MINGVATSFFNKDPKNLSLISSHCSFVFDKKMFVPSYPIILQCKVQDVT